MQVVGFNSGNNTVYRGTGDMRYLQETVTAAARHYKKHFFDIAETMVMKKPSHFFTASFADALVPEIVLSKNLINAMHIDHNDDGKSFTIWVEDKPGTARDWFFVLLGG